MAFTLFTELFFADFMLEFAFIINEYMLLNFKILFYYSTWHQGAARFPENILWMQDREKLQGKNWYKTPEQY